MENPLLITGASGFIGRHLLQKLDPHRFAPIYCLSRSGDLTHQLPGHGRVRWLKGDLFDSIVDKGLDSSSIVVHLGATTGKASPQRYFEVNNAGTRHLLKRCQESGVKKFLYVSTIAVKYKNEPRYFYARSKEAGETAVRRSGLSYTILRPTIVLGQESPGWKALSNLARLRIIPVPGDGTARIQPVDVEDVADAIVSILEEQDFQDRTYELGGPDVVSLEAFLRSIHRLYYDREPKIIHLPALPLRWLLASVEKCVPLALPLNSGQLSVFLQDGTIESNALFEKRRLHMKTLSAILDALTGDAEAR